MGEAQGRRPLSDRAMAGLIGGVLAAATALVLFEHVRTFFPGWTDENIHTYVAHRVSQGAVLYKDVDSARPPLVILPLAALMRVGLPPLLAARLLVAGCTFATAALIFFVARRLFTSDAPRARLWAAAAGSGLYLASAEVASRSVYTGVQLVACGSAATAGLALLGRPLFAGVAFGFALGAGQHSLIIGGATAVWLLLRRPRRQILLFLGGLTASFLLVFGVALALGGENLWETLVARHLYHLESAGTAKAAASDSDLGVFFWRWLFDDAAIFVLAIAATVTALWMWTRKKQSTDAAACVIAALVALHCAAVLSMRGGLFLYLTVAFPLICLLAGQGAARALTWTMAGGRLRAALAIVSLVIVIGAGWRAGQRLHERSDREPHYPLPPQLRAVVAARVQKMDVASIMARDLAQLPADRTVFGHGTLVSLVALQSGRRVSAELADLAPRWIKQTTVSREDIVRRIEADSVGALVTPAWIFVRDPYFKAYLRRCYGSATTYPRPAGDGRGIPPLLLFQRKAVPSPCTP